jgi:hypothetical protein
MAALGRHFAARNLSSCPSLWLHISSLRASHSEAEPPPRPQPLLILFQDVLARHVRFNLNLDRVKHSFFVMAANALGC